MATEISQGEAPSVVAQWRYHVGVVQGSPLSIPTGCRAAAALQRRLSNSFFIWGFPAGVAFHLAAGDDDFVQLAYPM